MVGSGSLRPPRSRHGIGLESAMRSWGWPALGVWLAVFVLLFPTSALGQEEATEQSLPPQTPEPEQSPEEAPTSPGRLGLWRRLQGRPEQPTAIEEVIRHLFRPRSVPPVSLSPAQVATQYGSSVVTVRGYDKDGKAIQMGSGIIIGQAEAALFVLTNHHVASGAASLEVVTKDGPRFPVSTIQGASSQVDLALLRAPVGGDLHMPDVYGGSAKDLLPGERVTAIGNPLGLERTVSEGIVSAIRAIRETTLIQTTAPVSPGSSGGPLFNDFGELVGLMTGSIPEGQNLNLAVAIDHLVDLLDGESIRLPRATESRDTGRIGETPSASPTPGIPVVEAGLLFAGIFFSIWWFSVIILPIVYGFPRAFYWVARGLAKWRAPAYYLLTPVIWTIVFTATIIVLQVYWSGVVEFLRHSRGFGVGQLLGLFIAIGRAVLSKSARLDMSRDFLSFMIPHLTPTGVAAIEEASLADRGAS